MHTSLWKQYLLFDDLGQHKHQMPMRSHYIKKDSTPVGPPPSSFLFGGWGSCIGMMHRKDERTLVIIVSQYKYFVYYILQSTLL